MPKDYQPLHVLPPEPEQDPLPSSPQPTITTNESLRYCTFLALGISLLWPWNCLLALSQHFSHDFTKAHSQALGDLFASTMMTVSTLTSLTLNSYLTTRQHANLTRRILVGSLINITVFVILAILDSTVPQASYTVGYFTLLMALVFVSSAGTCLTQNGTMSMVQCLGPHMAQGVMVGQAIAGVLPSFTLMVSNYYYYGVADVEKMSKSTVGYLLLTSLVTFIAGGLFLFCENVDAQMVDFNVAVVHKPKSHVHFITLFDKLRFIALAIFTVFLFTLVFPVFASNVSSVHIDEGGALYSNQVFIPFIFFIWNLGDLTGRVSCSSSKFVISSDSRLFIYALLRCLFIPLFFLCNLPDKSQWFIDSDVFYITLQFLFGFTNGHCLSSSFMNVGHYVAEQEREAAGAFCNVFLSLGLLGGSLLSYVFVWVL